MKKRIEVIGNIASGRSTLVELLLNNGYHAIYENFEKHPFLESFYKDTKEYAFETEMCFLLQHYYDFKTNAIDEKINVCDFSFYLDDAFARVTLDEEEYVVFDTLKNELIRKLGKADMVIYVKCLPETSLKRIHKRNRDIEQNINIEYLRDIDESIKRILANNKNILVIDTDKTSLIDKKQYSSVLSNISIKINEQ